MVRSTSLVQFLLVWGVLNHSLFADIVYIHMDLNTRVRLVESINTTCTEVFSTDTFYWAIFPLAPLVRTCIRRIAYE